MKRFLLALLALLLTCGPIIGPKPAYATVSTTSYSTTVSGNGSQTVFSFSFPGVSASSILVVLTDSSGNQTVLTRGAGASQYTVSLNAAVQGATLGYGGTVTYPNSGTPVPAGSTLTIYRSLPLTQNISLQNQASFGQYARSAETMGDLLELQTQQVYGTIGRAIVANIANANPPAELPPAAQMANMGLCGDSTGENVVACTLPSSGVISSAMQPVVNAATLAAGRTAFGLGAIATEGIGAGLQDDGAGNARVNAAVTADAISTAVTSAFHMTQRAAAGPITYTFPRANTLWSGFGFWIHTSLDAVTLSINANDNFPGSAAGVGIALPKNVSVYVSTDAQASGKWFLHIGQVYSPGSTTSSLLSGSGTYTTPGAAVRLRIRMVGGGGGGGGMGTGTSAGNGGNGGTTSFGSFTAVGGSGGDKNNATLGGEGGIGGTGGAGTALVRVSGQPGSIGLLNNTGSIIMLSGGGGATPFGGAGSPSFTTNKNAATNSGSGGAGGQNVLLAGVGAPGGGGAGEYAEVEIVGPASSYSYTVGAAGTAGTAGTSGSAGGTGAAGAIYVEALYN